MKILYFVRHGKGVPRSEEEQDKHRPLTEIGENEVTVMAKRFRQESILPELILCSPAERAQQTARIFATALGYDSQRILIRDELYDGDQARLIELIHHLDDAYMVIMLIGHNPALSQAAHVLAQNFDSQIRTSSVLGVHFSNSTWQAVSRESAHLFLFDFPIRLASKVQRNTQRTIATGIMSTMGMLLNPIDHKLPGSLRKTIEKTSHRLAKEVLHVLHTSRPDSLLEQEVLGSEDETHT